MANQLASNPMILDGSSLNTVLIKTWMHIEHFEYSGYANFTASKAQLADRHGNIIWTATGAQDNEEVRSGKVEWIEGLQELSHTDGQVLVYFK